MQNEPQSVSIWRNEPPATAEYIQSWAATLAAAFPNIKSEFWVIVSKIVRRDGLSQARLAYIAETLCRGWKYPTMQIADILGIDRNVKIWSYRDFVREFRTDAVQGYCILAERGRDGRIQFCVTADAELAGLTIQRKF